MNKNNITFSIKKIDDIKYVSLEFDNKLRNTAIGLSEGELICKAFIQATKYKLPLVANVRSVGMKITEGTIALMQMIKLVSVVKKHSDKGLLYIAIVNNPTLGGASASFVSLADIIIANKDCLYGFSGKRIIYDTTHENISDDFQKTQFILKHGMVDIAMYNNDIDTILKKILKLHKL